MTGGSHPCMCRTSLKGDTIISVTDHRRPDHWKVWSRCPKDESRWPSLLNHFQFSTRLPPPHSVSPTYKWWEYVVSDTSSYKREVERQTSWRWIRSSVSSSIGRGDSLKSGRKGLLHISFVKNLIFNSKNPFTLHKQIVSVELLVKTNTFLLGLTNLPSPLYLPFDL